MESPEISQSGWKKAGAVVVEDKLKPFWCYNISVYPMLQNRVGEPYSIQAYVKEGVPSAGPVMKAEKIGVRTVTITWKEIPKHQRNGFINNYTIFYQVEDGKGFSKTVNSSILRYDLESLTRKTSYTVRVMASTSAGGANGPGINFKTSSISLNLRLRTRTVLLNPPGGSRKTPKDGFKPLPTPTVLHLARSPATTRKPRAWG
ncbi:interleukin-31 receptor subunit alpha-like [Muntiacus reevesi]|uniref:interleukin-31 receptor subunit alpha-like n=1 Tax=Muntiacus reevesi TaxID=9886 RepID=UPI0033071C3C